MNFRRVITGVFLLGLLCGLGMAQTQEPQPQYFLTIGGGFSQYSDPHVSTSGSFGVRVADGLYSVTSLDMATKVDHDTKQRVTVSTIRTGAQKVLVRSGGFTLSAAGDLGLAAGAGNTVAAFSGGGSLAYTLPPAMKFPGGFVFGAVRIIKSPQQDPNANPATVATAFTFGVGKTF